MPEAYPGEAETAGAISSSSTPMPALFKELDCEGIRIHIFNSGKDGSSPLPADARDNTVFTISAGGSTPYFYPQNPSTDGIELIAQSDYRNLAQAKKLSLSVKGLSPDTVYYYQVDGSREVHRFRTMPLKGSSSKPFRFNVIGDTQGQYDLEGDMMLDKDRHELAPDANLADKAAFNKVADAMRRGPAPDFIAHLGDITDDGRYSIELTREMFGALKHLLTLSPVYPVMGNHENHAPGFFRFFSIPAQKGPPDAPAPAYYSIDWGDVHFIFLDSNRGWDTIYDIDRLPGAAPESCDFEGNTWNCSASRVKGGISYVFNDEAVKRLCWNLSKSDMEKLKPLNGVAFNGSDAELRRRLQDMGFDAKQSRMIRTASICCETRNLANGRVALSFTDADLWKAQMDWLEKDLEAASASRYVFVFSHNPLLKDGLPRLDLVEKLERHKVSACFSGHLHIYRHELRNGVHHFVSGGGSDLAWSQAPAGSQDFYKAASDKGGLLCLRYGQQYISVEVGDSSARILGIDLDGQIFEDTTIQPANRVHHMAPAAQ